MDNNQSYADMKSRVICYGASGKAPEVRAVGSVTMFMPGRLTPYHVKGRATIVMYEVQQEGGLRDVSMFFDEVKQQSLNWYLIGMLIGAFAMRLWYVYH